MGGGGAGGVGGGQGVGTKGFYMSCMPIYNAIFISLLEYLLIYNTIYI